MSERHTIMIVDDDASNLMALEDLLSPQYEIVTANNGLDALQMLKQDLMRERIHLLISDQRMPGLTGAEFLNRSANLLPNAKRILLTGYTDVEAIIELVNEGELYKFVLKPFDHNVVQATVRRALEAFDMEQQNKRLIKQLTMLNENLERTVEERTQELQQTLAELEAALAKLRQLNTTKDKFFSIVAHDLRNTLQAFLYASETIVSFIDTFDKQQIARLALNMNKMANNLHGLLENLLDWAKLQKGQFEFNPEPCNAQHIAQQCMALFEEDALAKVIKLNSSIPAETWVYTDKNVLKAVLRNLLSNAIKFTHAGGLIRLEANPREGKIELVVNDNGVGIADEILGDILRFDRQISQEGTNHERGTGLGLPLCQELLEAGGSALQIRTQPGQGTRISFVVPTCASPHQAIAS